MPLEAFIYTLRYFSWSALTYTLGPSPWCAGTFQHRDRPRWPWPSPITWLPHMLTYSQSRTAGCFHTQHVLPCIARCRRLHPSWSWTTVCCAIHGHLWVERLPSKPYLTPILPVRRNSGDSLIVRYTLHRFAEFFWRNPEHDRRRLGHFSSYHRHSAWVWAWIGSSHDHVSNQIADNSSWACSG